MFVWIPLQYEYATVFSEGLTVVFKDEAPLPFYINHKGEKAFDINHNKIPQAFPNGEIKGLSPIKNGVGIIKIGKPVVFLDEKHTKGYTFQYGLISRTGKWFLNPIYHSVKPCGEGLFKVICSEEYWTEGIVDTLGNWVVPLGLYYKIDEFKGDYAQVKSIQSINEIEGSINPSQFWRKQDYRSNRVIDSYDD